MKICVEQRGNGRGFPQDTASTMKICVEQKGTRRCFLQDTASIRDLCGTKRHWKRFSLGYFDLVFRCHSTNVAHTP
jgi:hypothetical protein